MLLRPLVLLAGLFWPAALMAQTYHLTELGDPENRRIDIAAQAEDGRVIGTLTGRTRQATQWISGAPAPLPAPSAPRPLRAPPPQRRPFRFPGPGAPRDGGWIAEPARAAPVHG